MIPVDAQPVAVVTLWPEAVSVDAATLRAFYDAQADADARLAAIEMITDMLMTPTGKLDKITLRKRFAGG